MNLTTIQKRRKLKLIRFLESMPRRAFDFGEIVKEKSCGTVACAVGWTTKLFPGFVRYVHDERDVVSLKTGKIGYANVASELFGGDSNANFNLFAPDYSWLDKKGENSTGLLKCGSDASPKRVAKRLRKCWNLEKE